MTTGWVLVNIAIAIVVTAIVAGTAVLVPLLLDRDRRTATRRATPAAQRTAPAAQRRAA